LLEEKKKKHAKENLRIMEKVRKGENIV